MGGLAPNRKKFCQFDVFQRILTDNELNREKHTSCTVLVSVILPSSTGVIPMYLQETADAWQDCTNRSPSASGQGTVNGWRLFFSTSRDTSQVLDSANTPSFGICVGGVDPCRIDYMCGFWQKQRRHILTTSPACRIVGCQKYWLLKNWATFLIHFWLTFDFLLTHVLGGANRKTGTTKSKFRAPRNGAQSVQSTRLTSIFWCGWGLVFWLQ